MQIIKFDPTINCINFLVLDCCPLISEMISMIIHRILPQANVMTTTTFKNLCKLVHESTNITAVILDPKSPGCFGFSSVAYISKILHKSELVLITDAQVKFFKGQSVEKIKETLQKSRPRVPAVSLAQHH